MKRIIYNIYIIKNLYIDNDSLRVPFRGDYVGLRRNPEWAETLRLNRLQRLDRRIVFADIANKINRSNGKVAIEKKRFSLTFNKNMSELFNKININNKLKLKFLIDRKFE